jgi:hypothetical protein
MNNQFSKFGRAYRVFDEVVADFHTPVAEVGFEVGPLVDGIADGFPEFALGKDGTTEGKLVENLLDAPVDHVAFGGAHGFTQCRTGFGVAQPVLDVIEVGELSEDPGDETRRLVHGFEKLAPHMGVAAHEFDPCRFLGPGWIDDVAIALDDAQQRDDFRICQRLFLRGAYFLERSIHALGVAGVFATHELDAEEFGGLVVELLAHFPANAAESFGVGHDLGRVECLSNN